MVERVKEGAFGSKGDIHEACAELNRYKFAVILNSGNNMGNPHYSSIGRFQFSHCFSLNVSLVCASTVLILANTFNVSPRGAFQRFSNCHLKFIYAEPELVPGRINYLVSAPSVDINF